MTIKITKSLKGETVVEAVTKHKHISEGLLFKRTDNYNLK